MSDIAGGGVQCLELIGAQTGPHRFRRFFYSATKFAATWCRLTLDLQVISMIYVDFALTAGAEKGTFFHEPKRPENPGLASRCGGVDATRRAEWF